MSKKALSLSRRTFLQASLAAGAALPLAGKAQAKIIPPPAPFSTEQIFTACDMCFNRCGVVAHVSGTGSNRRIVKLDPNPACSKSRGMLCARGNAGIEQVTSPNRLHKPLLRVGKRGENQWKEISWEEALALTAEKMQAIGAQYSRCGMLFTAGADTQSQFVHRFAEGFGSFNITTHESLCLLSGNRAFMDTYGEVPQADVLHCDYIVMLGANRFEALVMPDSADLMQAMRRGAKLIAIDPRCTKTAELASKWYAIRPGTDLAYLLALAHVIITEQLYNAAWVEQNTHGLEQLRQHVAQCTPQWAEAETGIAAQDIITVARELAAAAPKAMVYPGRRSSDYPNATQIRRGFAIINALLANYDCQGGLMAPVPVKLNGIGAEAPWYDDNQEDRVDAAMAPLLFKDEGSFVLTRDAVLTGKPYPIKGWFIYKTNPMGTAPDREKTKAMMDAMDFVVCMDIVMSDTAFFSDLVLPSTSYLERDDPLFVLPGGTAGPCVMTRNKVVPPVGESRPVFEVTQDLATRLGFGDMFAFTLQDFRRKQLQSLPGLEDALRTHGVFEPKVPLYGIRAGQPFRTPSKKIELYSETYKSKGIDPLPVYTPPEKGQEGSFRLVAGRTACITQSSSLENALLAEFVPGNTLWMHPQEAKRLGIATGDKVEVQSRAGKEVLAAEVTAAIRPDTVYMHTGFGTLAPALRTYHNGASISALLESDADTICGNAALHTTHVTVRKTGGA